MSVSIREVKDRSDLRRWVKFPYSHYRGQTCYVPPVLKEELSHFDGRRTPAFEVSQAKLLLAVAHGRSVGRICGIINSRETRKLGRAKGRFGWFECIDDPHVAERLLDAVRDWLIHEQCTEMTGPHGFTDLDPEGLLIDGFDRPPTISGGYHHPYYRRLLERYGFEKDVDYVEYRCAVPDRLPLFERMRQRYCDDGRYRVVSCSNRKELRGHTDELWALLQEAFEPLYGVVPLTSRQVDYYTRKYFGFLDPDFVKLTFSASGEMVGFLIAIPNLSRSFQKAGGHLFPFGFWHILREFRRPQTVDFLLGGAKPGEPSGIITAVTLVAMLDTLRERGVRYLETNHELESNTAINRIWSKFDIVYARRSRIYRMALS